MILIMGLGAQLLLWPDGFCKTLVGAGHRVIRFDNRDIGLSSRFPKNEPIPGRFMLLLRSAFGLATPVPYTLADMAGDASGLMDHLGLARADIAGASMGGMIAQVFAARYPERTASLAVLMSSTNQPFLPGPKLRVFLAMLRLMKGRETGKSAAGIFADSIAFVRTIASPGYPTAAREIEDHWRAMFARSSNDPDAVRRQSMAIFGTGDLRRFTHAIEAPTVVIHGDADPLVRLISGRAVARAVAGSRLEIIPGMGHDLPSPVWERVAGVLHDNAVRGRSSAAADS
jgi:pimeloyl-ACP methyl ester carboxylesterase